VLAPLVMIVVLAEAAALDLSPAERAWIEAHPAIRMAQPISPPFALADQNGELAGISIDHLKSIEAATGLHFVNIPVRNSFEALEGVRDGRFDALMGIGKNPVREEYLLFGRPYAYSPDAIVSRSDAPFLFDIHELGGRRVGLARSSTDLASRFRAEVSDAEVVTYDTMADAIAAVQRAEIYAAVTDATIAAYVVRERKLLDLKISGIFDTSPDVFIGVRRDWPELVRLVDRALLAMPASERSQITNRWAVLDYEPSRRWQRAYRTALVVLGAALLVALGLVLFNRRMNHELAIRRRIQAELEVLRDRLAEASAEKSGLMHTIAHDLKGPLASVLANTRYIERAMPGEEGEAREALADMKDSLARMSSLVEVLVEPEALATGERPWRPEGIDTVAEVRAAAQAVAEAARAKGVGVDVRVAGEVPLVESDRQAFREVVENLLSNAVKFTHLGTHVEAAVAARTDALSISVRDHGPGIPPDEHESIFEKYGVGSARPTGGETSTGLGLWIVRKLVRRMGGHVWCEDAAGGGATFRIELPLARPEASRAGVDQDGAPAGR